jgi:hypothetical protein
MIDTRKGKAKVVVVGVLLLFTLSILMGSGVAPSAYNTVLDEAVAVNKRPNLNFTGTGVACVDNAGANRTDCSISGGTTSIVGTGGPNYSKAFAGASSLTITAAEHGFNHAALLVSCYDNATPPAFIEPTSLTIDAATFQVALTFAGSITGYCVVNGGAGTGCAAYTILSTNAAFVAASTTADVSLFTLPQYGKVQGVTAKHSTIYSDGGGAMTDVTVSVGDGTGPFTQYLSASSIGEATPVADTTFYDASSFKSTTMAAAGGTVSSHFIAVGGPNFGNGAVTNLVSGSVTLWVCSLRVQ